MKKLITRIMRKNKKVRIFVLEQCIKENLISERQKRKIISGMKFDKVIDNASLENKTLIIKNKCLFINSTLSNIEVHGSLNIKQPYNCIITDIKPVKLEEHDDEKIQVPDFI